MKFYIGAGLNNFDLVNYVSEKLTTVNWIHTYNWASNGLVENETEDDLERIVAIEHDAIIAADIVIILLPAGRGSHVELGMALALNKKVYLYSKDGKEFEIENTAGFYWHPGVIRIIGEIDKAIDQIKRENYELNSTFK